MNYNENEVKPEGGWLKYYRRQQLKETIKDVALLFFIAALYIFGCNI